MTRHERALEAMRRRIEAARLDSLLDWYARFAPRVTRVAMCEPLRMHLHNAPSQLVADLGFIPRGADGAFEYRGFYLYRVKGE